MSKQKLKSHIVTKQKLRKTEDEIFILFIIMHSSRLCFSFSEAWAKHKKSFVNSNESFIEMKNFVFYLIHEITDVEKGIVSCSLLEQFIPNWFLWVN